MLGLLGILVVDDILIGIAITAAISAITTTVSLKVQQHYAEKAEKKNDALMDKQEKKAKANALSQFNQALAWGRGGVALAEKSILEAKREERAKERNYGEPTVG